MLFWGTESAIKGHSGLGECSFIIIIIIIIIINQHKLDRTPLQDAYSIFIYKYLEVQYRSK